jgi:hypothetical protein
MTGYRHRVEAEHAKPGPVAKAQCNAIPNTRQLKEQLSGARYARVCPTEVVPSSVAYDRAKRRRCRTEKEEGRSGQWGDENKPTEDGSVMSRSMILCSWT